MANVKLLSGVAHVISVVPLKDAALHWCFNDEKFGAAMALFSKIGDKVLRTRSRLHRGPHMEVQYELLSYGIPTSALPFNGDGDLRRKDVHTNFLKMLEAREQRLRKGEAVSRIILPSNGDCLFGRGKPVRTHPGNLRLGFLVEERLREYVQAGRPEKVAIANDVYRSMKEDDARFLKQDDDGAYTEVDQKAAVAKIEHFFRNRKQLLPSNSALGNKPGAVVGGTKRSAAPYTDVA
jgi:hypothetical protein